MRPRPSTHRRAMMLEDVAAVLAVLAIGALVLYQAAGPRHSHRGAHRTGCINNLKQVGLAMRIYANDHDEKFPWQVTKAEGGTLELINSAQFFQHFVVASNELSTPKILVCPTDRTRVRVTDFSAVSNTNLSYFLCLDAQSNAPTMLLSGDRHVAGGTSTNGVVRVIHTNSIVKWTKELHEGSGNVGLVDGSVQQTSPAALVAVISNSFNTVRPLRLGVP